MDVQIIFENVKRMLDYRLNSHRIKFAIRFRDFEEDSGEITEKVEYKIKTDNSGGNIAEYVYRDRVYKTAYLNVDMSHVKMLVNDPDAIVLHASNDRKIKKLIKSPHVCQFFVHSMFLSDYRLNVYFTYICKSNEKVGDNSNLQYISSRDFSVMYCGLKEGDVALAISIVDPTLVLPQLRLVKNDTDDDQEQQHEATKHEQQD